MNTNPLSLLASAAVNQLVDSEPKFLKEIKGYTFATHLTDDSLWIEVTWPDKAITAFRTAYAPDILVITQTDDQESQVVLHLTSAIGNFVVSVGFPESETVILHYEVRFTPASPLFVNYWPHDILIGSQDAEKCRGDLYINQVGIRSGIIHAGIEGPGKGALLYLHNLTALNEYCQQTQTSLAGTVGGNWPELGFSLPTTKEKQ